MPDSKMPINASKKKQKNRKSFVNIKDFYIPFAPFVMVIIKKGPVLEA